MTQKITQCHCGCARSVHDALTGRCTLCLECPTGYLVRTAELPGAADRARALLAEITPGPWKTYPFFWMHMDLVPDQHWIGIEADHSSLAYLQTYEQAPVNAEFIAAAPDLVAQLLAENDRLRAQLVEAWDQGFRSGNTYTFPFSKDTNPYRQVSS